WFSGIPLVWKDKPTLRWRIVTGDWNESAWVSSVRGVVLHVPIDVCIACPELDGILTDPSTYCWRVVSRSIVLQARVRIIFSRGELISVTIRGDGFCNVSTSVVIQVIP